MAVAPEQELEEKWKREQGSLRQQLVEEDTEEWQRSQDFSGLERVGGVDLSFIKGDDVNACAQLVVLSYPGLELLYEDSQMVTLSAPYIAGFLAFRETPCLLELLRRLEATQPSLLPQVVLVDGNGLFHQRAEFGLACHLGVLSGLPCVGVAKNLLQVQGVAKSEEHVAQLSWLCSGVFLCGVLLTVSLRTVLPLATENCESSAPLVTLLHDRLSSQRHGLRAPPGGR
ncbi:endonuclease V-like [Hypomesus transpacificus]|uniref:endonuclease V-like n=1 Tax=Hypomesus transpacificus TaxID=137520 RepID=UPI001F075712|nr:endonuclease V-like [Hypomesus transpacificus]